MTISVQTLLGFFTGPGQPTRDTFLDAQLDPDALLERKLIAPQCGRVLAGSFRIGPALENAARCGQLEVEVGNP